jgi:adenylate cyclase
VVRARNVPLLTAIVATLIALALCAIHLWVRPLPGLDAFEGFAIDARFKLRGPRPPASDRVVIVGLDDETRRQYPEIFQTRRGFADLFRALAKYDVKVIALDLFFSAPEVLLPEDLEIKVREADKQLAPVVASPQPQPAESLEQSRWELAQIIHAIAEEMRGDEMLAKAITDTKRIFLGAYFRTGKGKAREAEPPKLALARHGESADSGSGGARRPLHAVAVNFTLDDIAAGAIGAGALNALRDPDGVTRRLPLAIELGGRHYLPMGLAVALHDLGKSGDTQYLAGESSMKVGGRVLPVGPAASLTLDVLGKDRIPHISAADVMSGKAPPESLKNKLAFVGMTYASYDKVQTPLDQVANGVELHATLAENYLSGRILTQAGPLTTLLAGLLLCGFVIAAQLRPIRRRAWVPPLIAAGAIAGYLAIVQVMFVSEILLAVAAPVAMAFVVLAAATVGGLATEGREKAHLRAVFSQYVSRQVVDRILADPKRARLGGERKVLTVLFSDIRGFSAFSEGMGPEELANFISEYLTPMTELVLDSGGTLDKYIGDAVMAIWAAPVHYPDHAERACDVALKMQAALVELNKKWKAEGKPAVAIGVGINTGPMSVGNMGTPARFDYTVLGDQVNLGARLEALTKEYGVDILVGEETAKEAGSKFVFREIDVVRVKGRAGAAPCYELVGRTGSAEVDPRFVDALAAYRRRDFAAARAAFEVLAASDRTAAIFARRCAALAADPPPPDWDGVYEQKSK